MSSIRGVLLLIVIQMSVFFFSVESRADLDLHYSQTQNFWSILSAIQNGTGSLNSAAKLLNETFGNPQGLTMGIRYAPNEINLDQITLREVRFDGRKFF